MDQAALLFPASTFLLFQSAKRGWQESSNAPRCAGIFRFQVLRQSVECQRINMGGW